MPPAPLTFKIATSDEEFTQLHRLNHQTFAEEIPQHPISGDGVLRDKFHEENLYFVALRGARLVGMVALRDKRPFSLDEKIANLNTLLPPHRHPCEIRLLAIAPEERNGAVFSGLLRLLSDHCAARGYDLALISGTTRQRKLYHHLGFRPFGPLVGISGAQFQPMYLTLAARDAALARPVNLLPGPTDLRPAVHSAFNNALAGSISHRSAAFAHLLDETRGKLHRLTGATQVEIAVGTGTLANDIIAARLRPLPGPGLIISNGEFGERLIDHAQRASLDFHPHHRAWGEPFDWAEVSHLMHTQKCRWLWGVHCETSTGTLNDLPTLKHIAAAHDARLCLDCVSSIGAMPLDLSGVFLASGSSGKALGAPAGLALVFALGDIPNASNFQVPRYLDLQLYSQRDHTPFTHSAPLVAALCTSLDYQKPSFWQHLRDSGHWLRAALHADGWQFATPCQHAAPHIVTLALEPSLCAFNTGERLEARKFRVSYRSGYLRRRNWLQFCLMSEHTLEQLRKLPFLLRRLAR